MGKAIVYCGACGKSLLQEDFEKGRAVRATAHSFCAGCSPIDVAALPAPPPPSYDEVTGATTTSIPRVSSTARIPKASTGRIPTVASTRRIKPAGPAGASTTLLWAVGGAVLGILVLGGILAATGSPRSRPGTASRPAPPAPAPARPLPPSAPRPRPADPAPAVNVEEQMRRELAALQRDRFERDLQEAGRLIEGAHASERAAEIDGLLDALARVAGDRMAEVVRLRARHEERLAAAGPAAADAGARPAPAPPPSKTIPPGLEGRWTLEGLRMGKADDVSGHGRDAVAHGKILFVEGRLGRAALFEGDEAYLELPRDRRLDRLQEGPYTISAWFKPSDVPRGPEHLNGAFYGIVIKHGLHVGLSYSHEQGGSFEMMHWLQGVRKAGGHTSRAFAPGAWHHLAGTADPQAGRTRLYVNGEPLVDVSWPDGDRAAEPGHGRKPWRIGIALPKAKEWGWSAKGAVDDVRLYSRVLDAAEIRSLADGR